MKIIALFAVVALLVLPPLHAKPLDNNSLKQRLLSELLQRMIEEQEEMVARDEMQAQEEMSFEMGQNRVEEENFSESMGTELEVAEMGKSKSNICNA